MANNRGTICALQSIPEIEMKRVKSSRFEKKSFRDMYVPLICFPLLEMHSKCDLKKIKCTTSYTLQIFYEDMTSVDVMQIQLVPREPESNWDRLYHMAEARVWTLIVKVGGTTDNCYANLTPDPIIWKAEKTVKNMRTAVPRAHCRDWCGWNATPNSQR